MLLVIESRSDLAPVPADALPRSTAQALRAMDWPFPVDEADLAPRRPAAAAVAASNVVPLKLVPAPQPASRIAPRRAVPLFGLELAEAR